MCGSAAGGHIIYKMRDKNEKKTTRRILFLLLSYFLNDNMWSHVTPMHVTVCENRLWSTDAVNECQHRSN